MALIWLREQDGGLTAVVWLVFIVIATDIGGYIAGKLFGKRKLAPTISPNKTWEGLMGGIALAVVCSFVLTWEFKFIVIGAVFAVIEQISDLMESAIKRHYGVKDTGNILPGHGGVMDRLDGLVLTAPLTAIIVYLGLASF
jgi:phosphatidate cytidylyltransferase